MVPLWGAILIGISAAIFLVVVQLLVWRWSPPLSDWGPYWASPRQREMMRMMDEEEDE